MPNIPQTSFSSGELAPVLHRRPELSRYITGLKTCRNMFVHKEGGVSNRTGTQFIAEVKDSTKTVKLVEFSFNDQDTYALEFGHLYMRVIRLGGQVLLSATPSAWAAPVAYAAADHVQSGGVNYYCYVAHTSSAADEPGVGVNWADYWYALTSDIVEIPTQYAEADLEDLSFVQSADVITITHYNHPPRDLSRFDHDRWVLSDINFGPTIAAPTNLSVTGGAGTATFDYVVTAVSEATGEESLQSNTANGLEDASALTWDAVTGAESYNVYKAKNGVFGYIGNAIGTSFTEEKIIPDLSDTPPLTKLPFSGAGDYPSTVAYYEQRLAFANTINNPQTMWFSQVANFHNFNTSRPIKADDAITIRIDAAQVNAVRNLVPLNDLLVMTSGAEHRITSGDNPFSIENIRVKPQSYRGSKRLRPIVIGNVILYVQARGSDVRELSYALESDGYGGGSISITASHLFTGHTFTDWAYAKEPYSIVWMVRDDGALIGLTYVKEQDVIGWHRHDTLGTFESVCVVSEGQEDATYVVVRRTVNGVQKRYIERFHTRQFDVVEDCFFVDSGLSYNGAPVSSLSGLDHLEAETVSILADGNVHPQQTVTGGSITIDYPASKVHVGLPYTSEIETLEPPVQEIQGLYKSATETIVGIDRSRGMWVGPDADDLVELKQREDEAWGEPTSLASGYVRVIAEASASGYGSLLLRQLDPLPMTVLAVIPDYDTEG